MHTYLWRQCPCFPPWRAALEIRPPLALAVIIPGYGWLSEMTGHYSSTCVVPLSSPCIRWTIDKQMFYSYVCTSRLKCRRSSSQTPVDYLFSPQTDWNLHPCPTREKVQALVRRERRTLQQTQSSESHLTVSKLDSLSSKAPLTRLTLSEKPWGKCSENQSSNLM